MHVRPLITLMFFAPAAMVAAMPPIDVELATESGLQITAPHQWLQLLADVGVRNVRIRAATSADKPEIENRGSADRPRYHVVGILTASEQLRLPGDKFRRNEREKLADYFKRLAADGAESMDAPRGRFGLTEKEFDASRADLSQSLDFNTQGQSLRAVLDRMQAKFSLQLVPDAAAERIIRTSTPFPDELRGFTAGTGLAILLKSYGLALQPNKSRGAAVALRIVPVDAADDSWPIGWEPAVSPREAAPLLFEFLNVEIDGYTLQEAVDAIAPRIKLPLFWDHAALAANKIDPATVQVRLSRTRTYYKRVLDRVLAQARLHSDLRVDEAGKAFIWITR